MKYVRCLLAVLCLWAVPVRAAESESEYTAPSLTVEYMVEALESFELSPFRESAMTPTNISCVGVNAEHGWCATYCCPDYRCSKCADGSLDIECVQHGVLGTYGYYCTQCTLVPACEGVLREFSYTDPFCSNCYNWVCWGLINCSFPELPSRLWFPEMQCETDCGF